MRSIKSLHQVLLVALFALLFMPTLSHAQTNPLTGAYYGTATIIAPSALGTIDLAFYLDLSAGGAINNATSYISLDKTLLFPAVAPKIGVIDVGPRVTGSVTSSSFSLTSNDFISDSAAIGKPVTRKITLTGTTITNGGNSIKGDYTETLSNPQWKNTILVTGNFMLVKPGVLTTPGPGDLTGNGCIDLAEIRAGGDNPSVIEYSDLSMAFHIYMTPAIVPNLCIPQDTLLQSALQEYFDALQ